MRIMYVLLINLALLNASSFKEIELIHLDEPYVYKAYRDDEMAIKYCKKGNVPEYEDKNIIKFFQIAKEYDDYQPALFCFYPCAITGKIKLDGKIWDFELNAGGFAVLKRKDEKRYFGDESKEYECGV